MNILYMSDLHIDVAPMSTVVDGHHIADTADVVVLAGDIHEGVSSPVWAREAFPDSVIVMVAGNHEFYGRQWKRNVRKIREKAADLNIHFLENDSVIVDGVRFLGCTLWTDFNLYGNISQAMSDAQAGLNDYVRIQFDRDPANLQDVRKYRSKTLVPDATRQRHIQSVNWLSEQLEDTTYPTVVVTHHAPSPQSIHLKWVGHHLNPCYASDLTSLMGKSKVWIHGHIHNTSDYQINGTRVLCNPRGYGINPDWLNPAFDCRKMVTV